MKLIKIFINIFILFSYSLLCAGPSQPEQEIHLPCIIIIEQDTHNLIKQPQIEAMTELLFQALSAQTFPIIASAPLFYNFIYHKQQLPSFKNTFEKEDWKIFNVPNSSFVLLVPHQFLATYNTTPGFNLDTLEEKTELIGNVNELSQWLLEEKLKNPSFSVQALKSIFKPPTNIIPTPTWDLIIAGHGTYQKLITNLSHKEMQDLIHFFNSYIKTGVMYIYSCYAGGENLRTLSLRNTIDNQELLVTLNYIIIIGSTTDAPVTMRKLPLHNFFESAAQLHDRGTSLNVLLKNLSGLAGRGRSMHATSSIPQIWLPQGLGFTTFDIDKNIAILNKVQLHIHEEDKTNLILNKKRALLVYPTIIPITIDATSSPWSAFWNTDFTQKTFWEYVPSIDEIDFTVHNTVSNIPATKALLEKGIRRNRFDSLFPEFISMQHGNATHHFSTINVKNNQRIEGVLTFIRDAFLDINARATKKKFLIDTLNGFNDILILLEMSRARNHIIEPHPLEALLLPYINGNITLNNVIIITKGYLRRVKEELMLLGDIDISFEIDNTAWQLILDNKSVNPSQLLWNFKAVDFNKHRAHYTITKLTMLDQQTTPQDIGNDPELWSLITYPSYIQDLVRHSPDLSNQPALYVLLTKIFNTIQQSPHSLEAVVKALKGTWRIPPIFEKINKQLYSDAQKNKTQYIQKLHEELTTKTALTTSYDQFIESLNDYYQLNKNLFEEYKKELTILYPNHKKELEKLKPFFKDNIKEHAIKSIFEQYFTLTTPQISPFTIISKNDNILLLDVQSSSEKFVLLLLLELAKNMTSHLNKSHTLLLSTLSGYNDVLPFLEVISRLTGQPISPLAQILNKYINTSITLEKIIIETTLLPQKTLSCSLSFIFEDKAWKFSIECTINNHDFYHWNIEEVNKADFETRFNTLEKELIQPQKTISETLKEKAKKITQDKMKLKQPLSTP